MQQSPNGIPKPYVCRKCGRDHSYEEYAKSKFCLNCGTWLGPPKPKLVRRKKENLPMIEKFFAELVECLEREPNKEYLRTLTLTRTRDEKWLKRQVTFLLREYGITPTEEKYYPFPSWQKCDVFFQIAPYECWLEMKTLPTNYCGGGGKPITQFIGETVNTISKLAKIYNEERKILLLMLFYPFCGNKQEINNWNIHLGKIRKACEEHLQTYRFLDDFINFDLPINTWELEFQPQSQTVEARIYLVGRW